MAERLVLHPAPALIQRLVGEPHHVERVSDLHGVGEHRVEHRLVGRRQVQRRPADPGPPRLGSGGEPGARPRRVTPGDDVEELPAAHVDDLGRPPLTSERAVTGEQRLVQPERVHGAEAAGVIDQRPPEQHHRVHHRVPVRAQVVRDLGRPSGRGGRPAASPIARPRRHLAARRRDPRILLGPRPPTCRASPALLAPHQPGRPPEHRQIDQHDLADTMAMRRPFATRRPLDVGRDHDAQPLRPLADTDHAHVGQADQQRAHARSIRFQAGAPRDSTTLDTAENHRAPVPRPGPLNLHVIPPSDPKRAKPIGRRPQPLSVTLEKLSSSDVVVSSQRRNTD